MKTVRVISTRINNGAHTADNIGNKMTCARANAKTMPAEPGRDHQPWQAGHFADTRNTVRSTVHITGQAALMDAPWNAGTNSTARL